MEAIMDLILWRHAEAVDGSPDFERELTAKGRKQARDMANWLHSRLPEDTRVITSPARRALQTAQALTSDYEVVADIAPGASSQALLKASRWPNDEGTVVLVGHQPELGLTAASLLTRTEFAWSVRKGAIWWFTHRTRGNSAQVVLSAVMTPELLK